MMTGSKVTLLAIYDMDKTVTRRATYNGFLLHMAFNKSPWRLFLSPLLPVGTSALTEICSPSPIRPFSVTPAMTRRR